MRDLFDDFLEELRRREAQARGEPAPAPKPPDDRDPDDRDPDEPGSDDDGDDADGTEDEPATSRRPPPQPIRSRRRPGGPDDGAGMGRGRRVGLWVMVAAIIALFLLFTFGIDLWTDALWYASVHFDGVFWTRVGAQALLFIGGLVLALVVLLGNLALAARLSPPPGPGQAGLRGIIDRVNDAASAGAGGRGRPGPSAFGEPRTLVFDADDLPDLTPIAGVGLVVVSALIALTIGGSLAAAWETILLWAHQVPFSPGATAVTDPIFGRDIGFFLFQLPFLRLVQGLFNALVIGSIIVVLGRYLVGAARGGLVFSTPVRVHLAVLGGLFLLSVAFGYQLDKYELVYSTRGVATGVSFTDQHAQFFAFDVLTIVSGLAAALLVGAAFTRYIWPLGLTARGLVLRLAGDRPDLPVGHPAVLGRPEQVRPGAAVHRQQHRDDPARLRPRRLGEPAVQGRPAADPGPGRLGGGHLPERPALGLPSAPGHARPAPDRPPVLRLHGRRHRPVHDRRPAAPGDALRARARARAEPQRDRLGEQADRVHPRHRRRDGAGQRGHQRGPAEPLHRRTCRRSRWTARRQITQPRIYFGERDSDYVVVGAQQDEFDYPTGEGDASAANGTDTRWTGTTGIRLDNTLMRLLFSLRFRDLDLMISDQVTADSQLLFHRSLSDRLSRIAPFLKFDKDPYIVVDDAGRLVYIQDAYTTSDRFPNAQAFDPGRFPGSGLGGDDFDYIRNSVKITVDAYDGTMTLLRQRPDRPDRPRVRGRLPDALHARSRRCPPTCCATCASPSSCSTSRRAMFGRYHVTDPQQFFRNDDLWTVPSSTGNEQTLPSEAYYVVMRMPGESHAEFLLLQPMVPNGRPNMIAWIAARNDAPNYGTTRVYRFPAGDHRSSGRRRSRRASTRTRSSASRSRSGTSPGSAVIRGNLIVVPIGDSIIYLQPVYLKSTSVSFPEFQRIVVALDAQRRLGADPEQRDRPAAARRGGGEPVAVAHAHASAEPGRLADPAPTPGPSGSPGTIEPLPNDVPGLIAYANRHYDLAQAALRAGDFAGYGRETAMVKAALDKLDQLAPSVGLPSPSASPAQ